MRLRPPLWLSIFTDWLVTSPAKRSEKILWLRPTCCDSCPRRLPGRAIRNQKKSSFTREARVSAKSGCSRFCFRQTLDPVEHGVVPFERMLISRLSIFDHREVALRNLQHRPVIATLFERIRQREVVSGDILDRRVGIENRVGQMTRRINRHDISFYVNLA